MLNAAVIGLGWWGKQIINCLEDSDRIKVVTAVDVNAHEGATFAASKKIVFTSRYEDVLTDAAVDAVILVDASWAARRTSDHRRGRGKQIFIKAV